MEIVETVRQHFKTSYNIIKSDIRILKIIVYYALVFASQTLLFFYSQQYYKDLGYNKIQIGVILLMAGTGSCIGALSSSRGAGGYMGHGHSFFIYWNWTYCICCGNIITKEDIITQSGGIRTII